MAVVARVRIAQHVVWVLTPVVLVALFVVQLMTDVAPMTLVACLGVLAAVLAALELFRVEASSALKTEVVGALGSPSAFACLSCRSFRPGVAMELLVDAVDRSAQVLSSEPLSDVCSRLLSFADCGAMASGRSYRGSLGFAELTARVTDASRRASGMSPKMRTAPVATAGRFALPKRCPMLAAMCSVGVPAESVDDRLRDAGWRWHEFASMFAGCVADRDGRAVAQLFDGMFDVFEGSPVELLEVVDAVLADPAGTTVTS